MLKTKWEDATVEDVAIWAGVIGWLFIGAFIITMGMVL